MLRIIIVLGFLYTLMLFEMVTLLPTRLSESATQPHVACYALPDLTEQEGRDAVHNLFANAKQGPTSVSFSDSHRFSKRRVVRDRHVHLDLPDGYMFISGLDSALFFRRTLGIMDFDLAGTVTTSSRPHAVLVKVSDKSAYRLSNASLLEQLKTGPQENNCAGINDRPEHFLWVIPPRYGPTQDRIELAFLSQDGGITYTTYVLGRESYIKLSFTTRKEGFDQTKAHLEKIAAGVRYDVGYRYQDSFDRNFPSSECCVFGRAVFSSAIEQFVLLCATVVSDTTASKVIIAVLLLVFAVRLVRQERARHEQALREIESKPQNTGRKKDKRK